MILLGGADHEADRRTVRLRGQLLCRVRRADGSLGDGPKTTYTQASNNLAARPQKRGILETRVSSWDPQAYVVFWALIGGDPTSS